MDAVGRDLLPSYGQMKERFESRLKKKGPAERLFAKLTGLDVKMEQYQLGERFVNAVVGRIGVAGVNRGWRGPGGLPAARGGAGGAAGARGGARAAALDATG